MNSHHSGIYIGGPAEIRAYQEGHKQGVNATVTSMEASIAHLKYERRFQAALAAMTGLLANSSWRTIHAKDCAEEAVEAADALIAELEKRK